ncbi:unnamed protein product [Dibothriocephalus latus]|uniref:Uncharacterized protein n=1 Tax=Dibothriocephalus latus TaxID=60516 RepID=A0A3P6SAG1_DIBLA|nr:unnamed protein product [Dibothriocephalus latus]
MDRGIGKLWHVVQGHMCSLKGGWLTGTPAFISIKITLIYGSQNIFDELRNPHYNLTEHGLIDKDIVLFRSDATAQHDSAESSSQNKFFLRFEVDLFDELGSASESDFIVLLVYISDCVRTERVQAVLKTTSAVDQPLATQRPIAVQKTSNPAPHLPGTMLIDTHGMHTPLPFLLLSVFLGSLYMILFLAFVLLCLCRPQKRQFLFPVMSLSPKDGDARRISNTSAFTDLANSSTSALMSSEASAARMHTPEDGHGGGKMQLRRLPADQTVTSRKVVIFFYVCFRAFTILLFTFSVGLSLILSLESSSFKILLACVQNVKGDRVRDLVSLERAGKILPGSPRLASHWLQELRKIEQTSMSELRKQTQQFINQSVACEMQEIRSSGELGLTMEELANLVVLQTQLTTRNGQTDDGTQYLLQIHNVVNATWRQIQAEYWQHYNFSVHGYMESVRSLLDNLLMQHWAPYETLLDRMMDNAWLSTARRAMDSPNDALRTVNEAGDTADRFSMRSNSVNYLAGLTPVKPREVSTLTFSGFLGIPQPANARLAEARLWNK